MTSVAMDEPFVPRGPHVGELRLRRFRADELPGEARAAVAAHVEGCATCRARLRSLDDEQRQFEREIPFERFAGGVERAARVPRAVRPRSISIFVGGGALAFAAAAALVLVLRPAGGPGPGAPGASHRAGDRAIGGLNATKGLAMDATLRVAAARGGVQRTLDPGSVAALLPGDRVRIGYRTDAARFLVAVSIDDAGVVSPLYPQEGPSLQVARQPGVTFLPDALEFTGAGRERVFLFLADRSIDLAGVVRAVREAFERAGRNLERMQPPALPAGAQPEQFSWILKKP